MWSTNNITTNNGHVTANCRVVDDLVFDIALGITNSQLVGDTTLGKVSKKQNKNKPRTNLHEVIDECLELSNYKDFYKWEDEFEFVRDGIKFEVIKYDITTGDKCLVKMDDTEVKMTKKQLREWYEG